MLGNIEARVIEGLEEGKMSISQVKGRVSRPRKAYFNEQGQPYSLEDYQSDLQAMRRQIQSHKVLAHRFRRNSSADSRHSSRRPNSSLIA